jgi:N-acetylglucosaminyldiphosphoundecaprenol N-acetyl-beta-D-mannosaminyltransferase
MGLVNYFNVNFEFDETLLMSKIDDCISNEKVGYVCVVDSNVLTNANKDRFYLQILNNSLVNTCDGSSIAFFINLIYKTNYQALNGPYLFEKYIKKSCKQLFLGGSFQIHDDIRITLELKGLELANKYFIDLPFVEVNEFDFNLIGKMINDIGPDIIWVSLGAPKQEKFMYLLWPKLNKGVLFGIGAAFNFYVGQTSMPKFKVLSLRFIWIARLLKEPRKQYRRMFAYLLILPQLLFSEMIKKFSKIV